MVIKLVEKLCAKVSKLHKVPAITSVYFLENLSTMMPLARQNTPFSIAKVTPDKTPYSVSDNPRSICKLVYEVLPGLAYTTKYATHIDVTWLSKSMKTLYQSLTFKV